MNVHISCAGCANSAGTCNCDLPPNTVLQLFRRSLPPPRVLKRKSKFCKSHQGRNPDSLSRADTRLVWPLRESLQRPPERVTTSKCTKCVNLFWTVEKASCLVCQMLRSLYVPIYDPRHASPIGSDGLLNRPVDHPTRSDD